MRNRKNGKIKIEIVKGKKARSKIQLLKTKV